MTEQSTTETTTKPSVVDDFFSALFANNSSTTNSNSQGLSSSDNSSSEPSTAVLAYPSITSPIPPSNTNQSNSPSATTINTTTNDINNIKESSQQEVSTATLGYVENNSYTPERSDTSMIESGKVLDEFDEYSLLSRRRSNEPVVRHPVSNKGDSPAQILSKKDIDWSTVKPESRMLVRQLPKFADKQEVLEYFTKYGEVIEVVQKNSFGFVHFENPESCARAVQAENGKIYNGVILGIKNRVMSDFIDTNEYTIDLEICKRKPFFARVREDQNETGRRNISPPPAKRKRDPRQDKVAPPARKRNYSPTRSVSPPPSYGRRNSSPKMDFQSRSPMNNQRNRQLQYHDNSSTRTNLSSNSPHVDEFGRSIDNRSNYNGRRQDTGSLLNGRRADPRFSSEPSHGYNYNANTYAPAPAPTMSSSLIPSRSGNEVPTVQIISWSDAFHVLLRSVENHFSKQFIRTASITLPYSKATRDELVKQMAIEGVKAIVIIDNINFVNSKVYLQVFAPNGQGGGVRYDGKFIFLLLLTRQSNTVPSYRICQCNSS
jgi:RNA recognition motif-containing protein